MLKKISNIVISTFLLTGCAYNFSSKVENKNTEEFSTYIPKFYDESYNKFNFTVKDSDSYNDLSDWFHVNKERYSGTVNSNEGHNYYKKTIGLLKRNRVDFEIFPASLEENIKLELIGKTRSVIECTEFSFGCSNNRNLAKMVNDKSKLHH